MFDHRDAPLYAAGTSTPRPRLSGSSCGRAPLHQRVLHPRMKVHRPEDVSEPLFDPAAVPLTLRALRASASSAKPFDDGDPKGHSFDLALSGTLDLDGNEHATQASRRSASQCDGLVVPTAEDIADTATNNRLVSSSKSGRIFIGPAMKGGALLGKGGAMQDVNAHNDCNGAGVDTSTVPPCTRTKHFRQRVYHQQLCPETSLVNEARAALAEPCAVSARPFLVSAPPRIPPYERSNAEHCELMTALVHDHIGRSQQAQHEAALERCARAHVRREVEQRQFAARRALLTSGPSVQGPTPPRRGTRTVARELGFPSSARLHQLGNRLSDGDLQEAPRSTVHAFLYPSFVIPASRDYGSKKYSDAPKRRMAYEASAEEEEDASALLAKFEKTSRCVL